MELDKCTSAWLISRRAGPETVVRFYAKGTQEVEGTPFDIPGATWSRQTGKCTTEVILQSLKIDDPALRKIAGYARVTELARWRLDDFPEAREHYLNVQAIIDAHSDPHHAFEHVAVYLDELYEELSAAADGDKTGVAETQVSPVTVTGN